MTLDFLRGMFKTALLLFYDTVRLPLAVLNPFPAVYLTDSTAISLPASLATWYPASGGDASPAGLKLQLVFEFLTGRFTRLWVTKGITPDQKVTQHLTVAKPGSLTIFDLGYFVLTHLQAFTEKGAYFLCRWLPGTILVTPEGQRLDLLTMLRQATEDRWERVLRVGATIQLPCRVCVFRASDEVTAVRRRALRKTAARKKRVPSAASLELAGWTIFLTNAPADILPLRVIAVLYAVRWHIELIFKLWKSHMQLDHVSGYRKERVLVELYAKLIALVLFRFLALPLRTGTVELSPVKAFKRVVSYSRRLITALPSASALQACLAELHTTIQAFATREKRKTRLTTYQQLLLEVDYYA